MEGAPVPLYASRLGALADHLELLAAPQELVPQFLDAALESALVLFERPQPRLVIGDVRHVGGGHVVHRGIAPLRVGRARNSSVACPCAARRSGSRSATGR